MSGTINYDYDTVINTCKGPIIQNISNLETSINALCSELATCEDCFHSSLTTGAIPEIYNGFSECIGNTNANTGIAALIMQIANILNSSYSEAMRDKAILESSMTSGASLDSTPQADVTATTVNVQMPETMAAPSQSVASAAAGATLAGSVTDSTVTTPDATSETASTTGIVEAQNTSVQTPPAAPQAEIIVGDATVAQAAPNPQPGAGSAVSGSLSPGTSATTFAAQPYNLSDEEYKVFCATVYAEAAEGNAYTTSDTMGVSSAILNRVESGRWGGNNVVDVVSAKGQFSGYGYQNRKFAAAMSNPDVISPEMRAAIDRTLAGERNTNGMSFAGNGTYNKFR